MGRPIKYRKTSEYPNTHLPKDTKENSLSLTSVNIIFCRPIEITLFSDEIEALKLRNMYNLSQAKIAKNMKVSQPTIARTLQKAYKKITTAILEKKTIRIKDIHSNTSQNIEMGPKRVVAIERVKKIKK